MPTTFEVDICMDAQAVLDEIYETKIVCDTSGNSYDLSSGVDQAEGAYLHHLVSSDHTIRNTLEVGCAYGLSSLYICKALQGRQDISHLIIDPDQMSDWHGVGVSNLERAGIDFFKLITEPSEFVLPSLVRTQAHSFDLAFIDGWHTFDQTMVDLFYAIRLIRVGGYVVIDDTNMRSVSAAVSYFARYPALEIVSGHIKPQSWRHRMGGVGRTLLPAQIAHAVLPAGVYSRFYRRLQFPSMVALQKVAEDMRNWTWFKGF